MLWILCMAKKKFNFTIYDSINIHHFNHRNDICYEKNEILNKKNEILNQKLVNELEKKKSEEIKDGKEI